MTNATDKAGDDARFHFGENWKAFLNSLDEQRIAESEKALQHYLGLPRLDGLRFIDIGCGSGLSSLAARRLGARVFSFDYDAVSVECTRELKRRYFDQDADWTVEQGSVLDQAYLQRLGSYDIVYSWGVLHHTGAMWQAVANAADRVADGGKLFIALYNHQPYLSSIYTAIKHTYNNVPRAVQVVMEFSYIAFEVVKKFFIDLLLLRNPLQRYRDKKKDRGMSYWHDYIDWLGGYPFETATPGAVVDFFAERGFVLKRLKTVGGGHGCNEYVFVKQDVS